MTRHTMDTLSVMSPNQQLLPDIHHKDQSGFLDTSLPAAECPLLSENKSMTLGAQRPLLVDLASKAFDMLMAIKRPALSVTGLNGEVANELEIDTLCQKINLSDSATERKMGSSHSDGCVEIGEQANSQSEHHSGNCSQSNYSGSQLDQSECCFVASDEMKKDCTSSQCVANSLDRSVASKTTDQSVYPLECSANCSSASDKIDDKSCSPTNSGICGNGDDADKITEQRTENWKSVADCSVDNCHLEQFSQSVRTNSELANVERIMVRADYLETAIGSCDEHDRNPDSIDQSYFQNTNGSPLINSCANVNHSLPQIIFGDLNSMHGETVRNIFCQSSSGEQAVNDDGGDETDPELGLAELILSDNEQEVPYKKSDSNHEWEFPKFGSDLVTCQQRAAGADDSLATPVDGSPAGSNISAHSYDSQASGSPQCHLVPDVTVTPEQLRLGHLQTPVSTRTGVVFKEQKFSPMLTVVASPNHSNETSPTESDGSKCNSSSRTRKNLNLPGLISASAVEGQLQQTAAADSQLPCSPLTANDVRFTFIKESPRKAKLKRLNATKVTSPDSAHMNSVFERLSKVNKLLELQTESSSHDKDRATRTTPVKHLHSTRKVLSSPRLNLASQLRITAGMRSTLQIASESNRQQVRKISGSSEKMSRNSDAPYIRDSHNGADDGISPQCKATRTSINEKCDCALKKRPNIRTCTAPKSDTKDDEEGRTQSNSKLKHGNIPQTNIETRHSSLTKSNSKVRHTGTSQHNLKVGYPSSPQSNSKVRHSGTPQSSHKSRHAGSVSSNPKNRYTGNFPGSCKVGHNVVPQSNTCQIVKSQDEARIRRYHSPQKDTRYCTEQSNGIGGRHQDLVDSIANRHCIQEWKARSQQTPTRQRIAGTGTHSPTARSSTTPRCQSSGLPVYRKGTPRYCYTGHHGVKLEPVGKLDLDLSDSDVDICDLSSLDESIILQEKKVELERVQAEKLRLEKKLAEQAQSMKQSANRHQRSALRPTTVENMPRMRFNDTYTLKLSEPELDAITLVHTLCNSQQIVKRVTKAHATAVIGQNYVVKPASKVQWHEQLVTDMEEIPRKDCNTVAQKPILRARTPGFVYPFNDQPAPNVVVVKSSRKCLAYGKEASPLMSKILG